MKIFTKFSHKIFVITYKRNLKRTNLYSRCIRTLLNTKLDKIKFLILFGQVMLDKSYNYNKQVILNDINITNSIIKLINEAYNNNLDDDSFKNQFFNLSKTIYFFYQISNLYINLFSNETKLHEIFTCLIFKKKYDEDKNDYINSIGILFTDNKKKKFEELLIYINKNYDNKNDFKLEYIKLFNEQSYIDKINNLSKNSPESNKSKLEKILTQKIESVKLNLESNSLNINDIIHEHKIEN